MAKLLGGVDARGRPVIRVSIPGRPDEMLALVDTGFNGELMMSLGDAVILGVEVLPESQRVMLGHGESVTVRSGRLRIEWFGKKRMSSVLISAKKEAVADGPVALLGVGLLFPNLLTIAFGSGAVEIEAQQSV